MVRPIPFLTSHERYGQLGRTSTRASSSLRKLSPLRRAPAEGPPAKTAVERRQFKLLTKYPFARVV